MWPAVRDEETAMTIVVAQVTGIRQEAYANKRRIQVEKQTPILYLDALQVRPAALLWSSVSWHLRVNSQR
jgi:hypothetical protein